jgi:hypothetical protein
MEKFKLNSYCSFEEILDMEPYMYQTLEENEDKTEKDKDNFKYKLKGVITHYGISEVGHYTSYIRMDNGEWKYFDDEKITPFDIKNLGKECFGGPDDSAESDDPELMRMKNASVLMYQKLTAKPLSASLPINP